MVYRLLVRGGVSSATSFDFPFPTTGSRGRLDLMLARVIRDTALSGAAEADEGCSELVGSRSLPWSLALDFCFAALTLALVRKAFKSAEAAEAVESWSGIWSRAVVDALALLVAS
jgi:hypothetical protein